MKTIKSYLPFFTGFYDTLFECDCEEQEVENYNQENDTNLEYDDFEFDYDGYRNRVAEACINSVWDYLKLDGFDIDIIFERVSSPRFYNYENDEIQCTYKVTDEDFKKLVEYCKTNLSEFKTFLEDVYSSRPGFSSFFDTDAETWFNEYLNDDNELFEKAFTGILTFYLENEGWYSKDQMFDDISGERWIDFKILNNSN